MLLLCRCHVFPLEEAFKIKADTIRFTGLDFNAEVALASQVDIETNKCTRCSVMFEIKRLVDATGLTLFPIDAVGNTPAIELNTFAHTDVKPNKGPAFGPLDVHVITVSGIAAHIVKGVVGGEDKIDILAVE